MLRKLFRSRPLIKMNDDVFLGRFATLTIVADGGDLQWVLFL